MIVGLISGVAITTSENVGLYGVSVMFLLEINDYVQWFLRELVNLESIIVSVERAFIVTNLPSEK